MQLADAPSNLPVVIYNRPLPNSCEKKDQVAEQAHYRMERAAAIDWQEAVDDAPEHDCVDVEANDPLYVLYTSGTTGWWSNVFLVISHY